jgi:hypothetical protein
MLGHMERKESDPMKALRRALVKAEAEFRQNPTDENDHRVFGLRNQIRNQEELERKNPRLRG